MATTTTSNLAGVPLKPEAKPADHPKESLIGKPISKLQTPTDRLRQKTDLFRVFKCSQCGVSQQTECSNPWIKIYPKEWIIITYVHLPEQIGRLQFCSQKCLIEHARRFSQREALISYAEGGLKVKE